MKVRALLFLTAAFDPRPGEPDTPEAIMALVDEWLTASHSPSLCLPRGVSGILFDADRGTVLCRLGETS